MKILVFGNIGSGKSYLINEINKFVSGFEILAIDEYRKKYSDGTMAKEIETKIKFMNDIKNFKNQIIEAMGFGETGEMIAEKIKYTQEKKIVIMLSTPLEICIRHLDKRVWNIPYPAPIEKAYQLAEYTNQLIQEKFINILWENSVNTTFLEFEIMNKENLKTIKQTILPNYYLKQFSVINRISTKFPLINGITGVLLIGSFGRGNAVYSSDIDISVLVDENFNIENFKKALISIFENDLKYLHYTEYRNKLVVLFNSIPKLEFSFYSKLDELNQLFIGSEISDFSNCILLDKSDLIYNHVLQIVQKNAKEIFDYEAYFIKQTDKFIYDFENFSSMHKRSDAYKSYFLYNLALNDCFQLLQLKNNNSEFLYLPKNIKNYFTTNTEKEEFNQLSGTLYLPETNNKKRNLLSFFYQILENQSYLSDERILKIKEICEWIYKRDFGYNFRDISENCAKIKSKLVYRTSTLTRYQNDKYFDELIEKFNIQTIIDIRAHKEIEKDPYNNEVTAKIKYVWAPFDPWNQSEEFKQKYCFGSNSEIAYRFFAIECKNSINTIAETVLEQNEGSIAIHCHAGKDRTGCIIALFYMLFGAAKLEIYNDYFASEADTKEYKLNSFLEIIKKYKSIEDYFISCGLSENQVNELKLKLTA